MAKTIRFRIAQLLEPRSKESAYSKWFDRMLILLILLNVMAVILSTMGSVEQRYGTWLFRFEVFSVMVFTIEYLLRIWSSVELSEDNTAHWKVRLRYMISPMAIVDLVAILPFYLSLFLNLDLRFLRILRLVRIAKLGRYSNAMQLLYKVFANEHRVLIAALVWLLVLMVIASSGIYLIEHNVQPDEFGSIPQAMWWAMATLTTVGYGDVTPITPLGKFFAGTITVISMAMVALPAGILASSFSEQLRKRRDRFRAKVKEAYLDGVLDINELDEIDRLRKSLDISQDDAQDLLQIIQFHRNQQKQQTCPHCGKPLTQTDK